MTPGKRQPGKRGPDKQPRKNSRKLGQPPGPDDVDYPPDTRRGNELRAAALPLLVRGDRIADVASALDVTARSVQRWLREAAYAALVYEGINEINADARRFLAAKRRDAAEKLWRVVEKGKKEDMAKVKALELTFRASGLLLPGPEAPPIASDEERMSDAQIEEEILAEAERIRVRRAAAP